MYGLNESGLGLPFAPVHTALVVSQQAQTTPSDCVEHKDVGMSQCKGSLHTGDISTRWK